MVVRSTGERIGGCRRGSAAGGVGASDRSPWGENQGGLGPSPSRPWENLTERQGVRLGDPLQPRGAAVPEVGVGS